MRVLIIADDLTGALDSAVTLVRPGLGCVVARRPEDVAAALARRPDVLAVNTGSREGSAAAARDAVVAVMAAVGPVPEIVFKKVDSRLKGHVSAEIAALMAVSGHRRALVAPAIPAQGRVVVGGWLSGTGVAAPIEVTAGMGGLETWSPDTVSDADFDAALAAAPEGSLLVGAAGLAAALGRRLAPGSGISRPKPRGPLLLAIGSHDPITLAQVARLESEIPVSLAPEGVCPPVPTGVAAHLVRLVAAEGRVFDAPVAGARFAEEIAGLVQSGDLGALFACGGETADAILGALGQGVLDLDGEIMAGVPVATMRLGTRRLWFITKSGGFGEGDALAKLVEAVAANSLEDAG